MSKKSNSRASNSRASKLMMALIHLLVVMALLLGTFAAAPSPVQAASTGLIWPDGSTFTTFGGNEIVLIDFGIMEFINGCPTGINDFIYPFTNVYIVPSGSVSSGSQLTDVGGVPNTVMGAGGGVFVSEIIGSTAPGGFISPGTYAVVYDECQDGVFDANDSLFDPAFEVNVPVDLPPINPLASLKAEAALARDEWRNAWLHTQVLFAAIQIWGILDALTNPVDTFLFLVLESSAVILADPKEAALVHLLNTAWHYQGIAADPPDYNFEQLTSLPSRQLLTPFTNDPLLTASVEMGHVLGNEAAIAEAALHALERYQGAHAAGSGEWGLIQARAGRDYALLLREQLAITSVALADMAGALATDVRPFDSIVTDIEAHRVQVEASGFVTEQVQLARNLGLDEMAIDQLAVDFVAQDFGVYDTAVFLQTLTDRQSNNVALMAELDTLAADWQAIVDALESNPFVVDNTPQVDAGDFYTGTVGTPLAFDGGGSISPIPLTVYEWDLDGDGLFDEETGITIAHIYTQSFKGLVGLRVTNEIGKQNVGYAFVQVNGSNSPPQINGFGPTPRSAMVTVGASKTFTVTVSDPDGDPVTREWFVDGALSGTGDVFAYTPLATDVGTHTVEFLAQDDQSDGGVVVMDWAVSVLVEDGDGDGWHLNVDCADDNPAVYPGATEILFNGIDDDCDATTPDIGSPAVVDAGVDITAVEGDMIMLTATFTDSNPANTHSAVFSWGDGAVTTGTVGMGTATSDHVYGDNGNFQVEVCLTDNEGAVGCDSLQADITNAVPLVDPIGLDLWSSDSFPFSAPPANWIVAPDRQSVLQTVNGAPSFFYSDFSATDTILKATVRVADPAFDDDYIGFAFGYQPGDDTNPDADYLLVDWKKLTQNGATRGLAVSRVTGIATAGNFWAHSGAVQELVRATNRGNSAWASYTSYRFSFHFTATNLQVYVNDVLEIDVTGDFADGRFAFYNFSQSQVTYSAFEFIKTEVQEGSESQHVANLIDPGFLDTHTAVLDWGDGTAADNGNIGDINGSKVVTGTHRYADNGSYTANVCVTDDDDDMGCNDVSVTVVNAPPVVNAGVDQTINADLTLAPATFTDLGVMDTHTATVGWGDGITVSGSITEYLGSGTISATHVYSQSGIYDVQVCVTDSDGAAGCDGLVVTATIEGEAPFVTLWHDNIINEGGTVTHTLTFSQSNAAYIHTGTVDWGDGTATQPITITNDGGSFGVAYLSHIYLEDGLYTATFSVCNDSNACASDSALETVVNAPPIVEVGSDMVVSQTVTLPPAIFTDTGILDTHTAVIDWGDGIIEAGGVTESNGVGTVSGTHTYMQAGVYTIEVCVMDDDGGSGCDHLSVTTTTSNYYSYIPIITK